MARGGNNGRPAVECAPSTVGVIGASGFIGGALARELTRSGSSVVGFSRRPEAARAPGVESWRGLEDPDLGGLDALVNLAGEPIDQRWTDQLRRRFRESRVGLTRQLVAALAELPGSRRPRVLVNASAVGYYGDRGDDLLDESAPPGGGFLAGLCCDWEEAALAAADLGVRAVVIRIGVVLGAGGGALERLRKVYSLGLGGRLGSGGQWMPWVHVDDLARVFAAAVADPRLAGPVNGVAPQPVRNRDFNSQLAAALRRPAPFAVPAWALRVALGGFGDALLDSQRAVPAALEGCGFGFRFPELGPALADLLRGPAGG